MTKSRTTVTLDSEVMRALKIRAARLGKGDGEIIEEALRRHLGLDLLDHLWASSDMDDTAAQQLAVEAQHSTRPAR